MRRYSLSILAVVLLLFCLVIGGYAGVTLNKLANAQSMMVATDTAIRNEIAERLTVSPTWDAIERHIYCKFTPLGRSLVEVENDLLQVDTFKTVKGTLTNSLMYLFNRREIYTRIYGVYIQYDSDNRVVDAKIRETQGSLESYIYKQFDCTVSPK